MEQQALVAFLASLPAVFIGFNAGGIAYDIGSAHEVSSILLRSLVCATVPTISALIAPRFWLLPSLIYGFGFYSGYTFGDAFAGLGAFAAMPFLVFLGPHLGSPSPPEHPELVLLFCIALWFAAFAAFLRRHYWSKDTQVNQL